jgi:uracil-DNA glycosylase family 4
MLVGEQPWDQEDRAGRPFVGPAETLLNELLEECGLERERLFVTNAVKHFKWKPRGKRRLAPRGLHSLSQLSDGPEAAAPVAGRRS